MQLSENSRVWIYQADRPFTTQELVSVQSLLDDFTSQWQAHGHQLAAASLIRYNRFIILIVDESRAGATGCSIDKSVNLMKAIEQQYGVNLFDRFNIAYRENGEVYSCGREDFEALIAAGRITADTVVFNNLVQTLAALNTEWEVPLKNSWHARVFSSNLVTA